MKWLSLHLDWMSYLVISLFNTVLPEDFVQMVKRYKINVAVLPRRYPSALTGCPDTMPEAKRSRALSQVFPKCRTFAWWASMMGGCPSAEGPGDCETYCKALGRKTFLPWETPKQGQWKNFTKGISQSVSYHKEARN